MRLQSRNAAFDFSSLSATAAEPLTGLAPAQFSFFLLHGGRNAHARLRERSLSGRSQSEAGRKRGVRCSGFTMDWHHQLLKEKHHD